MSKTLECWIRRELNAALAEGEGRNNQMIQLAPRMMELGWSEPAIFDAFKAAYGLQDARSKDPEIHRVIRNARKYVRNGVPHRSDEARAEFANRAMIRRDAGRQLEGIFKQYHWPMEEVRALGWCRLSPDEQRRASLNSMFSPSETVWCGDKYHSGKPRHAANFRTAAEWAASPRPYPFVSHCTFRSGSISRSNENVADHRHLVVESDKLSHDQVLALFCWLHHECDMRLRAAVFSGRRSIHGWFERPSNCIHDLSAFMEGLSCDPASLRPSQPVRLAGVKRPETGHIQELLYLGT